MPYTHGSHEPSGPKSIFYYEGAQQKIFFALFCRVEFQSKFYKGEGFPFQAFSFFEILKEEALEE